MNEAKISTIFFVFVVAFLYRKKGTEEEISHIFVYVALIRFLFRILPHVSLH